MVVVNCWYFGEILKFVSDSFFFLPHSLVILFVCRIYKGTEDKDTLRLKFHFGGLRLFFGVEYFPKPVEIDALSLTGRLKDIIEPSEAATRMRHC